MFNKKTVIVVGAGASSEAKLPTGGELKTKIATMLDFRFDEFGDRNRGDDLVYGALKDIVMRRNKPDIDLKPYIDASWKISEALPLAISIDNFLDGHQGDAEIEQCGKLAIVRAILNAERHSLLYVDPKVTDTTLRYHALNDTWYSMFWKLLTESCTVNEIEERLSLIELIVFNYDRCIEHFLYHALQTYYKIGRDKAADLVRSIKIYHPYGTVGGLHWYGGYYRVGFGEEVNSVQLVQLADQIKTFTEGTDPNASDIDSIRNDLVNAEIVIFLGFAFHQQNLKLLQPIGLSSSVPYVRYFGTAKGISNSDRQAIASELSNFMTFKNVRGMEIRNDLSCSELFREYWRSLSLS